MSKSSTAMSETKSEPFNCIHCGHNLASLITTHASINCPQCNQQTDPYNTLARNIQKQSLYGVFIRVVTAALLPGIGLAFVAIASPLLFILLWPTIIPACFLSDRILKQTPKQQRMLISLTLWTAWVSGIATAFLTTLSIL